MSVLVGTDGAVQVNLGGGLKYVADIFQWNANLKRSMLSRTTQADDFEKNTGGMAAWSGDFSFRMRFSDDATVQSAWQMLNFALTGTDDTLKSELELILQTSQLSPDYDVYKTTVGGVIKLTGTIVIGDIRLDCKEPGEPVIAVASWAGDGALALVRA